MLCVQHVPLRIKKSGRTHSGTSNTVLVKATTYYKPDDEDAYETDQWGYTETEYLPDEIGPHLYMVSRLESGTRLKNHLKSQRVVSLTAEEVEVLRDYIETKRIDKTDDADREPLVTTVQGRPTDASVRRWMYMMTQPCLIGDCPHDRDPDDYDFLEHGYESGCPSTHSPHRIRTGTIYNMREQGISVEDVAERVDATPETVRQHYDFSADMKRLENRRSQFEDLQ